MKKINVSLFTAGSVLSALIGFSAIMVAAKYSDSGSIGEYSLYQASLSCSLIFIGLSIEQSMLRNFHGEQNIYGLLKSSFVPGGVIGLFLIVAQLFIPTIYSLAILRIPSVELSFLICTSLILNYFINILCVITRLVEKGGLYALGIVLPKIGFLMFLLITVLSGKLFDTTRMIYGSIIGMILTLFCFSYGLKDVITRTIYAEIDFAMVRENLHYAIPLCFTGLLFSALTYLDRFILNSLGSKHELDLYAISVSMAGFATIFQAAFSTVWAPIFYKWLQRNEAPDEIKVITNVVTFIIVSIWSMLGLFGWVLQYVLPSDYQKSTELLLCCVAFPLFYTITEVTGIGINVMKRTVIQLWITVCLILVNGCLSVILIPKFGAQGAAISSSISFFMYFVIKSELSNRVWHRFDNNKICIIFALLAAVSVALNCSLLNYVQSQFIFGLLFLLYVIFNLSELKSSLGRVKMYLSR